MEKEELKTLLIKYRSGQATDQEKAIFESWYLQYQEEEISSYAVEELLEDLNLVWMALEQKFATPKTTRPWPRIMVAAAAAVAVILSVLWLYKQKTGFSGSSKALATVGSSRLESDIAPGKNTATLTLSDGRKIKLSDEKTGIVITSNKLSYNDGSTILSSGTNGLLSRANAKDLDPVRNGMTNVSTPRGGTYQITLSDGTKVWLNAASSIIFPSTLSGTASHQRRVELVGEAYFEVSKDKKHPFIVSSKGQEVEVLGTHFNINAYADEGSIKTTLLEGSVRVSSLSSDKVVLQPNQQATLTGSSNINVKAIDPTEALAWKKEYFQFNDTPLEAVMRQMARWYDVEVVYKTSTTKSVTFNGSINRHIYISEMLQIIEETEDVKFKIEGRKIIVQ